MFSVISSRSAPRNCPQQLFVVFLAVASMTGCSADKRHSGKEQHASLPIPTTISNEAQAFLTQPINNSGRGVTLTTNEDWYAFRDAIDNAWRPVFEQWRQRYAVTVTKKTIAGVTVWEVLPERISPDHEDKVLLNVHGGGYVLFAGDLSVYEALSAASLGKIRVLAIDYRMPPDHPFPAAIDDAVAVYREILNDYAPTDIGLFGGSAGGGLAAAMTLVIRDEGLPMPVAVALNTPWSDLSKTGDSYFANDGIDPVLVTYDGSLGEMARVYANGRDYKDPLLSPVYADYSKGFPPTFFLTGTRDLFLSNTVRHHRALRNAGIEADLHVFEALWHDFADIPEKDEAVLEMMAFFDKHFSTEK